MQTERIKLSMLKVNENNPRTISNEKFEKLVDSILVFPNMLSVRPIVVDEEYRALGGNMRTDALREIGKMSLDAILERLDSMRDYNDLPEFDKENLIGFWKAWLSDEVVDVVNVNGFSDEEKRQFIIKDNLGYGEWDWDILSNEWDVDQLKDWGVDIPSVWDEPEEKKETQTETIKLSDRYIVPPFSILDTRQGYWKERKKLWNELIGDDGSTRDGEYNYVNENYNNWKNKPYKGGTVREKSVSILDPVMAEVVCEWYGIEGGGAFDVFAGDTVFGYVSASKGMNFTGIELRKEQADINNERTKELSTKYICDDGRNVLNHIEEDSQDLLFSCPPYYNLEVYSKDERDASNQQSYEDFIEIIEDAFSNAVKCLKNNRFAVVVVGDVRDRKTGAYYCFQDDIKRIFRKNGMVLYNEIILIQPIGNAALRANSYMKNRKTVKVHEYILVFYKGDTHKIKDNFKTIEYESEDMEQFIVDE